MYDTDGRINYILGLLVLQYTWKMRMQENTFDLGWNFDMAHCVYGISCHVSATKLHKHFALTNLKIALSGCNPDNKTEIWRMMKNTMGYKSSKYLLKLLRLNIWNIYVNMEM